MRDTIWYPYNCRAKLEVPIGTKKKRGEVDVPSGTPMIVDMSKR